jgi:hypothetical protein
MKHFATCATACALLVLAATLSAFAVNYNASKSNTGNIVIVYSPDRVTQVQATAVLAQLEKLGAAPDEAAMREILKKQGVQADGIKQIVVTAIASNAGSKAYGILLLEKAEDEAAAREAGQRVTPMPSKK